MLITTELLQNNRACKQGIEFVSKFYPDGIEMIDLIKDKRVSREMLHWGRKQLTHTQEELDAYCAMCNIINSNGFWYSENIKDCEYVVKSSNILSSKHIFNSKDVTNSVDVVNSEQVEDSSKIFSSEWISNSTKILSSKNIENSRNICNSTLTIGAANIFNSSNILNSSEIVNSQNITNSTGCMASKNLTNCLFCYDLNDKEYHIFNTPIDRERFNTYKNQYQKLMQNEELVFVDEWPEELTQAVVPSLDLNLSHYYKNLPDKFWKWARTLPNFDEELFYNITMNPKSFE